MNQTFSNLFIFATGAAIGSLVTWKLLKTKYQQIANDEIESVKSVFSRRNSENNESIDNDEEEYSPTEKDISDYKTLLDGNGYTNYSIKTEKMKINEKEDDEMVGPYVISPEEFDDNDEYETESLRYYEDHVLTDMYDNIIDDIEGTVGEESLTHFGEFEDDSVFVRNDDKKIDYEILLVEGKYGEEEMNKDEVSNEYFEWMYHIVCNKRYSEHISYRKLFMHLHNFEFVSYIRGDENRINDGIQLRRRFSIDSGYEDNYLSSYLKEPCSVLEMMLALAIRCEETIMDDPKKGNRTGQWFWDMVINLGLGAMTDYNYEKDYVENVLNKFVNREYEPDGRGGLFTIRNCNKDLRKIDIWCQLCWYLDNIS